jgi:hypothetical protein
MKEFHESGGMVRGANCSFIVLIPKKKNSLKLSEAYIIDRVYLQDYFFEWQVYLQEYCKGD